MTWASFSPLVSLQLLNIHQRILESNLRPSVQLLKLGKNCVLIPSRAGNLQQNDLKIIESRFCNGPLKVSSLTQFEMQQCDF